MTLTPLTHERQIRMLTIKISMEIYKAQAMLISYVNIDDNEYLQQSAKETTFHIFAPIIIKLF